MSEAKKRIYLSTTRQRQASETRGRIVTAARKLLEEKGYSGMTMEAIAQEAEVAVPTVYANFRSKTGVVAEILDAARFGEEYQQAVREVLAEQRPVERLQYAPRIARRIYESESSVRDLLRGAGALAPALARQDEERECRRYEMQKHLIEGLVAANQLRPGLDVQHARDLLWALTSRDLYRMLVRERGWTPQEYQDWLAKTVAEMLAAPNKSRIAIRPKTKRP
ncbi:MAG TPA: helix-turn-helix domain-containing protein [Bryobacteraceae bacterium]|jgi:AcrR family transcriptional regulator|nr:helix-turn-helix domain-containing protein [Bryobacteraceae bacterium]